MAHRGSAQWTHYQPIAGVIACGLIAGVLLWLFWRPLKYWLLTRSRRIEK